MTKAVSDKHQFPEQLARSNIDSMLERAGWKVQSKNRIDFSAGLGIAVREYQTIVGFLVPRNRGREALSWHCQPTQQLQPESREPGMDWLL